MTSRSATALGWVAASAFIVLLVVLGAYLPCPFHAATGLRCPGCGSQRALEALLHGRIGQAWSLNAALFSAPPLIAAHAWVLRARGIQLSFRAFQLPWGLALLMWAVYRNLLGW
jgi:hypothetical protein